MKTKPSIFNPSDPKQREAFLNFELSLDVWKGDDPCEWGYNDSDNAFLCLDCKINTMECREYFAISDGLWTRATTEKEQGGNLCIKCLERRCGYRLFHDDFEPCTLNFVNVAYGSGRLKNRIGNDPTISIWDKLKETISDFL